MAKAFRTHNLNGALGLLEGAMGRSLQIGGNLLKQAMQERSPVWSNRMTRSVHVGPVTQKDGAFRTLVGPTVDYSKYTELEPWIIGRRPGPKSQIKGATIPWMQPAADDVRDELQALIMGGVRTTIKELQRRYNGIG